MRKYYIVDISGKVELYDFSLFKYIKLAAANEDVRLYSPCKGLLSLVPSRFRYSDNIIKRLVKVIEGLLNYVYIGFVVACDKPDVIHLQWLPFMEVVGWEVFFIRIIKSLSPKTKIVLTIHNVYPHNSDIKKRIAYKKRFMKISVLFDAYIVHTRSTKEIVAQEFCISQEKIHVCYHGVFEPRGVKLSTIHLPGNRLRILQFGGQSFYKGTDLLVRAVCGLDQERKSKIDTHIVGGISQSFLGELKRIDTESMIYWKPYFLDNNELYNEINEADLVVLPYRAISQSGVLLLSIYFEKMIICSDLPSFKETLHGEDGDRLDDCFFFKSEDVLSLRNLIIRYIDGQISDAAIKERIVKLKNLYSWDTAAKQTILVYKEIISA